MHDDLAAALSFGSDQPERFLTAWYGPPDRPPATGPATPGVPGAILGWLQQIARWDAPVITQNSVPADGQRDDGVLLVGIENQGVWLWGVRDTEDDPPVLERENEPGKPWTTTRERLTEYLWHFLLFETALGGRHGLGINNATWEQTQRFLTGWSAVAVNPWRWPGPDHALWFQEGALAFTCANEPPGTPTNHDTYYAIFVACRDGAALARIDRLDLEWDWQSDVVS